MAADGIGETDFVAYCVCGGVVRTDKDYTCLFHEMPICEAFDRMNVEEFATWLRQSKGLPSPHPEDWN